MCVREKMEGKVILFLCFSAVLAQKRHISVTMESDQPSVQVVLSHNANLECCYRSDVRIHPVWVSSILQRNSSAVAQVVEESEKHVTKLEERGKETCHTLTLQEVTLKDMGMYRCLFNDTRLPHVMYTHGTYLQVYKPMQKTLNLSERTKNRIIMAEGVLLLLSVLIPGSMLICSTKRLRDEQRRKGKQQENIYEGLNLDDCNSTYHEIQRLQTQGPYQDIGNTACEDNQFEKP